MFAMRRVDPRVDLAAASRGGLLPFRRVERQQALIERLYAARGERIQLRGLANGLGVSARTVGRDIDQLRHSGVPVATSQGRGGGVSLSAGTSGHTLITLRPDPAEAAALIASLAVLGPSVTDSATSAMGRLADALGQPEQPRAGTRSPWQCQSAIGHRNTRTARMSG